MAASDAAPGLVNLPGLMDDAKCFAFVRQRSVPRQSPPRRPCRSPG